MKPLQAKVLIDDHKIHEEWKIPLQEFPIMGTLAQQLRMPMKPSLMSLVSDIKKTGRSIITKKVLVALFFISLPIAVHADHIYVITNPATPLSSDEVYDIFVGKKQFSGSVKLFPVDNSSAQGSFLQKVLQMEKQEYISIWTKKSFRSGSSSPITKPGDMEVIEFVWNSPGAVGYVLSRPTGVLVIRAY